MSKSFFISLLDVSMAYYQTQARQSRAMDLVYRVVQEMSATLRELASMLEASSRNLADVFWTTLYAIMWVLF